MAIAAGVAAGFVDLPSVWTSSLLFILSVAGIGGIGGLRAANPFWTGASAAFLYVAAMFAVQTVRLLNAPLEQQPGVLPPATILIALSLMVGALCAPIGGVAALVVRRLRG